MSDLIDRLRERLARGEPFVVDPWHDGSEGTDRALFVEAMNHIAELEAVAGELLKAEAHIAELEAENADLRNDVNVWKRIAGAVARGTDE